MPEHQIVPTMQTEVQSVGAHNSAPFHSHRHWVSPLGWCSGLWQLVVAGGSWWWQLAAGGGSWWWQLAAGGGSWWQLVAADSNMGIRFSLSQNRALGGEICLMLTLLKTIVPLEMHLL